MSPNSRPPLTTRIRASFEGKRTKSEVTSPVHTNGFVTQEPQAFRTAIDEAINSEAFQTAIAANLARLIKPSIKDALDTLQPVVEAVYSHEVLLRKTNRSVEDILIRLDTNQSQNIIPSSPGGAGTPRSSGTPTTPRPRKSSEASNGQGQDIEQFKASLEKNNKRTVATLAELSSAVEGNNKKVAEVVVRIEDIQATLGPTKEGLDSLKSFSDTSNTNTAVMQAQLDQLKADIGFIIDAVGPDLSQNVKSINEQVGSHPALLEGHTTKLDAISTDLVALKGQADVVEKIQTVSADLDAFKSYIEGNISKRDELFSGLGSQVGNVLTVVEGHTGTLAEIKEVNASPAILEAVQKSNDSHQSHAAVLGEIKERSLAPGPSETAPAGDDSVSTAALEALKADIAALRENIESGLSSHNENLTRLGTQVDGVLTVVEGHKAADQTADILAAVQKSNDSHASHSEAFEGIKGLGGEAQAAPAYDTNFATLEAQIVALQTTLHSHTGALDEIKSTKVPSSTELVPEAEGSSSSGLEAEIGSIIATLESHTGLLNEIKDDVSAEILTSLHDIGQTQAGHSNILAEIRETDVSDEILTALHASNDSHAGHTAALQQLNDSHTAHTTSLDELKTRSVEKSAPAEAPTETGNLGALETQIATLVSSLEQHKATLAEIKDATNASNESHASHATSLDEIKSRAVDPVPVSAAVDTEALEAQIGALSATLDEHKGTLSAIHEATTASNASHATHAASLEEIKSRSVEPAAGDNGDAGPQIGSIIATLQEQNATLAAIKDTTAASHELHASHTTALGEIKDATTAASDFHTSHAATLGEIKDATSGLGDLHASHTTALGEIKDFHTAHAATLGEIKDATAASNESHAAHTATLAELKSIQPGETTRSDSPVLPAMEAHFTNILSTLEAQNGTLAEIKDATANPELLATVKKSHELLSSHTPLLESIKEGTSHEDILTHISELKTSIEESKAGVDAHGSLVKDLHTDTKSSYSELTQAIGALALGGAAGAGAGALTSHDNSEVLDEVKAVRAIVEKSSSLIEATEEKVTSIASQIDINHTTVTTSITTLSDELKAEIDATGTQITDSVNGLSTDVKSIDISTLHTSLDTCSQDVKSISAALESHVSEGVHLNEKGLGQLKEHSSSSSERGEPIPEGAWFKKSGSPVLLRSVVDAPEPEEKEYNYLSPVAEEGTPTQIETPILEETPKEEPIVEEPIVEEPVVEESIVKKPIFEESVVEKPIVEEPVVEAAPEIESEPIAEAPEPEIEAVPEPAVEEPQELKEEETLAPEIVPEKAEVSEAKNIEPEEEAPIAEAKGVEPEEFVESEPVHESGAFQPEETTPAPEIGNTEPEVESSPISEVKEVETENEPTSAPEIKELEEPVQEGEPKIPEIEPEPAQEKEIEPEEPAIEPEHVELEKEDEPAPEAEPTLEKSPEPEELALESSHIEPEPTIKPESTIEPQEPSPAPPVNDDEAEPPATPLEEPSTPITESEPSTSTITSPVSPSFPLSPSSKKGKKGKKEKKEKKGKGKKEKVPFSMDGEDPEDGE